MNTNYHHIPTTTTLDTSQWHKIRVNGLRGLYVIQGWLRKNGDSLTGGYMVNGNCIFFEKDADAVFCRLTIKMNADD